MTTVFNKTMAGTCQTLGLQNVGSPWHVDVFLSYHVYANRAARLRCPHGLITTCVWLTLVLWLIYFIIHASV